MTSNDENNIQIFEKKKNQNKSIVSSYLRTEKKVKLARTREASMQVKFKEFRCNIILVRDSIGLFSQQKFISEINIYICLARNKINHAIL